MGARTGQAYIKGLQGQPREIWLQGERVDDVTTHPALRHGVETIAALYDMQHDPVLREEMTYISPTSGEPVGLSFIIPRTRAELEQRRVMMLHWARRSCRHDGPFTRLYERHLRGLGRGGRILGEKSSRSSLTTSSAIMSIFAKTISP